jgi:dCTP deaminase
MSVLTGLEIRKQIELQNIKIDPFDDKLQNPASWDLRLGKKCLIYNNREEWVLDSGVRNKTEEFAYDSFKRWHLRPGIIYLMHTHEVVWTDSYVAVVDGKSSIGRLGIQVHSTAGYIDPGYHGQITLEVSVVEPVMVYPGMRFCQIRFMTLEGRISSYQEKGNYTGEASMGPVPSRSWKQFEDG